MEISTHRAVLSELDLAYEIVCEYYEIIGVVAREDRVDFEKDYFSAGTGIWLASINRQVAGCIALQSVPHLDKSAEVKRLYVRPAYRSRGVAKSLIAALEQYAKQWGYSTLYLHTKDDLTAAIRFYRNQGYVPCDRYDDNPHATVFMRKELQ